MSACITLFIMLHEKRRYFSPSRIYARGNTFNAPRSSNTIDWSCLSAYSINAEYVMMELCHIIDSVIWMGPWFLEHESRWVDESSTAKTDHSTPINEIADEAWKRVERKNDWTKALSLLAPSSQPSLISVKWICSGKFYGKFRKIQKGNTISLFERRLSWGKMKTIIIVIIATGSYAHIRRHTAINPNIPFMQHNCICYNFYLLLFCSWNIS